MLVETFPVGPLQCNCTVLACERTREALVVDPGGDGDLILDRLRHHGLIVKHVVHTHAHFDHIGATRDVKEAAGGEIGLHRGDDFLYGGIELQARLFGIDARPTLPVDRWLDDGDALDFGGERCRVLHTPGHTPGSICFQVEATSPATPRLVLAGDTLFRRSIGRTDLWGGDPAAILRSIRERLFALEPDTLVITGHGPSTTIGDEQAANPYVGA